VLISGVGSGAVVPRGPMVVCGYVLAAHPVCGGPGPKHELTTSAKRRLRRHRRLAVLLATCSTDCAPIPRDQLLFLRPLPQTISTVLQLDQLVPHRGQNPKPSCDCVRSGLLPEYVPSVDVGVTYMSAEMSTMDAVQNAVQSPSTMAAVQSAETCAKAADVMHKSPSTSAVQVSSSTFVVHESPSDVVQSTKRVVPSPSDVVQSARVTDAVQCVKAMSASLPTVVQNAKTKCESSPMYAVQSAKSKSVSSPTNLVQKADVQSEFSPKVVQSATSHSPSDIEFLMRQRSCTLKRYMFSRPRCAVCERPVYRPDKFLSTMFCGTCFQDAVELGILEFRDEFEEEPEAFAEFLEDLRSDYRECPPRCTCDLCQ